MDPVWFSPDPIDQKVVEPTCSYSDTQNGTVFPAYVPYRTYLFAFNMTFSISKQELLAFEVAWLRNVLLLCCNSQYQ